MAKIDARAVGRYIRDILLGLIGAGVLLLLGGIYLTHSFTWADVYNKLGLSAPQSDEGLGSPTFEIVEGELHGETAEVSFLAVGQGDCTVIRSGGMTAIIDGGYLDSASKISSFIKANDIKTVDYLFITHPHTDHIGSVSVILNSCEVKRCVMTHYADELTPTGNTYLRLLRQLAALKVPTSLAGDGETFALGGGVITALLAGGFDDLNDCSLILRFDYGSRSFLLMGDAGFAPEYELLQSGANIESDVIKIGHHGSKYATSGAFLAAVAPRYAVISCGAGNMYGYPTEEVVYIINKQGAQMFSTDTGQDVVFKTDGELLNVYLMGETNEIQR